MAQITDSNGQSAVPIELENQKQIRQGSPDPEDFNLPASDSKTRYNIYYTTSRTNFRLHQGRSDRPCVYYCETTSMTAKPRLQLRLGDSKVSPMVGIARLHYTSQHMEIGLGSDSHPEDQMRWEKLQRGRFRLLRADYSFSTDIGTGTGRQTFAWKREKNAGLYKTVYHCEDERGRVVASMLSGGMANLKKGGEVEVANGLDQDLQRLLVLSAVAIFTQEGVVGWSLFQGYKSSGKGSGKEEDSAATL